jgi:hypothetical protein
MAATEQKESLTHQKLEILENHDVICYNNSYSIYGWLFIG